MGFCSTGFYTLECKGWKRFSSQWEQHVPRTGSRANILQLAQRGKRCRLVRGRIILGEIRQVIVGHISLGFLIMKGWGVGGF